MIMESVRKMKVKEQEAFDIGYLNGYEQGRRDAVEAAPVRRGEWVERACRPTCPLCGFSGSLIDAPISPFKYCPNCGAKMDGGTP